MAVLLLPVVLLKSAKPPEATLKPPVVLRVERAIAAGCIEGASRVVVKRLSAGGRIVGTRLVLGKAR